MKNKSVSGQYRATGHDPDRLLTAYDVADTLQISARKVRRIIKSGELEVVRIGRLVRITPASLKAYVTGAAGK